jgi:hypothetical protein
VWQPPRTAHRRCRPSTHHSHPPPLLRF